MARIAEAMKLAHDPLYLQELQDRIEDQARHLRTQDGKWVDGKEQSRRPSDEELADPNVWEVPDALRRARRHLAVMLHEQHGYERYRNQRVPTLCGRYAEPGDTIAWIIGPGTRSVVHTGVVTAVLPNNTVRVEESDDTIVSPENEHFGYRAYRYRVKPQTTVIRCTHALVRL